VLIALATLGSFLALAVIILWLRDRIQDRRTRDTRTPEQRAIDAAHHRRRMESPDWEAVATETDGEPSAALKQLYATDLIHRKDFWLRNPRPTPDAVAEQHINVFYAADRAAFIHPWYQILPPGSFPFATDLMGDLLFVKLTPDGADSSVFHWHHDGGDIVEIAPTLQEFLTWERHDMAVEDMDS
jgi:hypothetical protein